MTPTEFLHALWPSHGLYCLATPRKRQDGTFGFSHYVFETIDAAAAQAEKLKDTTDVYFCIHSLKSESMVNPNTGKIATRIHANMQEASCFFFDIDVGPDNDKKYPTQAAALTGLKTFCTETQLPTPTIVSSGGGLHVYWPVDVSLLSGQWVVQATRLKALANYHGFKIDPVRTTDISSVLRVAGTFNHKTNPPRSVNVLKCGKVTPLETFVKLLNDAVISAGITTSLVTSQKTKASAEDIALFGGSNLEPDYGPPPKIEDVAAVCGQVARFVESRGDLSEPEWREAVRIGKACEGGGELVHSLSNGYAGYTREETERKAAGVNGVSRCETLRRICGEGYCGDCQYFKNYRPETEDKKEFFPNPFFKLRDFKNDPGPTVEIIVGETVFKEEIPEAPSGYLRRDGQVWAQRTDKNGEVFTYQVYERDLYPVRCLRDDENQTEDIIWRTHDAFGEIKDFALEAELFYDHKRLQQELAKRGRVYMTDENHKELRSYMIAYIKHLQSKSRAHAQINHLGWTDDKEGFILHDRVLSMGGKETPAVLSKNAHIAAQSLGQVGSLEKQVELLKFYNRKEYVGHQFLVLCGLAAPIFYATGQHGIIVNATGEPGASKSTAMMMAASMWGHPETYPISGLKDGATNLGRSKLTAVLANLPVCVDEITNMDPVEASEMAYSITQPRSGKIRCDRYGNLVEGSNHMRSTIMVCTANSSLNNMLSQNNAAATAGAMRVVEMFFPKQNIHQKFEAEAVFRELKRNYGWLGPVFIREWMRRREHYENRVIQIMAEIDKEAGIDSGERFWSANITAILMACEIGRALDIIDYDIDYLRWWCIHVQLPRMRGVITTEFSTPQSLLTDYLETISNHIIITENKPGTHQFPLQAPQGAMLGHYDKFAGQLHLLKKGFRDYCIKQRANPTKILEELWALKPGMDGFQRRVITSKSTKKTLGAGTDFAKSQSWCITIDMQHPDMAGLVEVASTPAGEQQKSPPKGKLRIVLPEGLVDAVAGGGSGGEGAG